MRPMAIIAGMATALLLGSGVPVDRLDPVDPLRVREAPPAPTKTVARTIAAREEDTRMSDETMRDIMRGINRTRETRHRSAGDRANKRMKRRRRAGRA